MSITAGLYNVLQQAATLDHTRASTQDTQALAQMRMFGLSQMLQTQQMTAKTMADIAAQEKEQQGQQQPPASSIGSPQGGGMDQGPLGLVRGQIDRLNKQAGTFDLLARSLAGVNPKQSMDYAEASAKIREQIAQRTVQTLDEQSKISDRISGLAGAAKVGEQDGLNNIISQMIDLNPRAIPWKGMDIGPNGMPIATPRTVQALQTTHVASLKGSDQEQMLHRIATENLAAQAEKDRNERAADALQARKEIADQNAELRRQGLSVQQSSQEQNRYLRQTTIAERVATNYTHDSKDFIEKLPYVKAATSYLFDADGKMKPTSAFTPAGDKAVAEAYVKTVFPDYKGSVYDKKGLDNLAGLPTRFVQYFVNLAEGKELPQSVRVDMFNAMQNQFKQENAMQIAREDNYRTRLSNSKVDPDLAEAYLQPYAVRPSAAGQKNGIGGGAADRMQGPDGKFYTFIGGPGGDRTLKSNWKAE